MNTKEVLAISLTVLLLMASLFLLGCSADSEVLPPNQLSPKPPANLKAVALSSDSIRLTWVDRAVNEQGFEIYEKVGDNGTFTILSVVPTPDVQSHILSGKQPSTTYFYYVEAYNQTENSESSNIATVTTFDVPPRAPANLVGALQVDKTIMLTWTDSSHNETGFRIERHTLNTVTWLPVGTVARNITQFRDSGVDRDSSYMYHVIAFNDLGTSPASNECLVNAEAIDPPTAPPAKYASARSSSRIDFAWEQPTSKNQAGFKVFRKKNSDDWATAVKFEVGAGVTLLQDEGLTKLTKYDYRVLAHNSKGESPFSAILSAETPDDGALVPPSPLRVEVVSSSSIRVLWTDNSDNENGFKIERQETGGVWGELKTCAANDTTYLDQNLKPRVEYTYRAKAFNDAKISAESNEASATPRIATPDNQSATPKSATKVEILWQDNCAEELGFRIERKQGDDPWVLVTATVASATSYLDLDLVPSTSYSYQVLAFNAKDTSATGDEISCETDSLGVPTNLTASARSTTQIDLSWTVNSGDDETGFVLQRHAGDSRWADINLSANDTTYSDVGLTPSTRYTYRIRAVCKGVFSANSEETSSSTSSLAAPANLTVTAQSSTSGLLKWEDMSYDETGFKIERKIGDGEWTALHTSAANTLSYLSSGLTPDVHYSYRVWAIQQANQSVTSSNEVLFTPVVPPPTDVAGNSINTSTIKISWTDASIDETGFKIERKEAGGNWAEVKVTDSDVISYTDSGLKPDTEYSYRLRAFIANGISAFSNEAKIVTKPLPPPSNVTAAAKSSTTVELTWQDSNEELGYKIERKSGVGNWVEVKVTEADAMSYFDTGLSPRVKYFYRLRAFHQTGTSKYSEEVDATPILPAPSNLIATSKSGTSISLSWSDNSEDEAGFKIERWVDEDEWVEIKMVAANETLYVDTGLTTGSTYGYRVRAYVEFGTSDYSDEVTAIPSYVAGETMEKMIGGAKFTFAWIPPGKFDMGTPDNEMYRNANEGPVHEVSFAKGFWMMTTEVTQSQWERIMGTNPAKSWGVGPDLPVYYISWLDVQTFEQNVGDTLRLPTDAEWEYACRAGTNTRYYWGDDQDSSVIKDYAWYAGNNDGRIARAVGTKRANAWGLYDMSGNAWEYCEDFLHNDYNGAPADGSAWIDPPGGYRVVRGGSGDWFAHGLRSGYHGGLNPDNRGSKLGGFRAVLARP